MLSANGGAARAAIAAAPNTAPLMRHWNGSESWQVRAVWKCVLDDRTMREYRF
jgi:hypothetical protein